MKENIVLTEAVYYILLSLNKKNHGYGIIKDTEELSRGRVVLAAGTLYGALNVLLKRGWILQMKEEERSRKKEYIITSLGKEILNSEIGRLKELYENGLKILKEGTRLW